MAGNGGGNGGDGEVPEDDNVAASNAASRQYDWRPRPDPTVLTTQQLGRAEENLNRTILERVSGLRELLEQRLDGMDKATELVAVQVRNIPELIEVALGTGRAEFAAADRSLRELLTSRIDAMDKATELLAATVGRVPSETDKAVASLRDLIDRRFVSMDKATELLATENAGVQTILAENRERIRLEMHAIAQSLRELVEQRLDSMDLASKVLAANVDKFPSDLDRATVALREVMSGEIKRVQSVTEEKFMAIDGTFSSNALALTAALAAQKEAAAEQNKSNTLAITKSESSTKETIAANAAQAQTGLASLASQFTDVKERVVRIESTGAGAASVTGSPFDAAGYRQAEQVAGQAERATAQAAEIARAAQARAVTALGISAVLMLISIISVIFAITKK